MKVYHPEGSSMMLMVTPGAGMAECPSDWLGVEGKPKRVDVQFQNGVAEVDGKLGAWLIEKGHANRTGLRRVTNTLRRAFA